MRNGSIQSLPILGVKWEEVSIDFIIGSSAVGEAEDSIMIVVNRAKMMHLIPCKKTTKVGEAARLYWQHMVKLHRVPHATHSNQDA